MTRVKTRHIVALMLASTLVSSGCVGAPTIGARLPRTSRFVEEWRHYTRLQPAKAMAVAGDVDALYVGGYAFGYADEAAAVEAALADCETRRIDRRIAAPCRTYAVGDKLSEAAALPPVAKR